VDPPASHRLATFPERHLVGEALAGGLRGVQCTIHPSNEIEGAGSRVDWSDLSGLATHDSLRDALDATQLDFRSGPRERLHSSWRYSPSPNFNTLGLSRFD